MTNKTILDKISEKIKVPSEKLEKILIEREYNNLSKKDLLDIIKIFKTGRKKDWEYIKRDLLEDTLCAVLDKVEKRDFVGNINHTTKPIQIHKTEMPEVSDRFKMVSEIEQKTRGLNLKDVRASETQGKKREQNSFNANERKGKPPGFKIDYVHDYISILRVIGRDRIEIDNLCLFNFQIGQRTFEMMASKDETKRRVFRLFLTPSNSPKHRDWLKSQAIILINKKRIEFNKLIAKGNSAVLDITQELIKLRKGKDPFASFSVQLSTRSIFKMEVSLEIVRRRSVGELMYKIVSQNEWEEKDKFKKKFSSYLSCEICSEKEDLERCSQCKGAWYCGVLHQKIHWSVHRNFCSQYNPARYLTKQKFFKKHLVGEISLIGEILSLKCPFSLKTIEIPSKGVGCEHAQCFDLRLFLMANENSEPDDVKCPICRKPLSLNKLIIDFEFMYVMKKTPKGVEKVVRDRNGKWENYKKTKKSNSFLNDIICVD